MEKYFVKSVGTLYNKTNKINWYVRENLAVRICLLGMLHARKFSSAKICTFTVLHRYRRLSPLYPSTYNYCFMDKKKICYLLLLVDELLQFTNAHTS